MAVTETIQELLQGIDDAQYGRDMRQFIHKGIQKCYEEGSAGETDLEARSRLDDVEQTIAELVDIYDMPYTKQSITGITDESKLYVIPSINLMSLHIRITADSGTIDNTGKTIASNFPIAVGASGFANVQNFVQLVAKDSSNNFTSVYAELRVPKVGSDANDLIISGQTSSNQRTLYGIITVPYKSLNSSYPLSSGTLVE